MMRFSNFISLPLVEGGKALKGASKITQAEVREIAPELLKKIADALKLHSSKVKLIGSAGKKPNPDDLSGDLDVAVEADPEKVASVLKSLGPDSREMKGINVYSFSLPVGNKKVQVDLMPVENINYAEWSYQAHPDDLKSGLKGAHRNEIMFAIAKHLEKKILKSGADGEPTEVERYFYDLGRGLMKGIQSRLNKKGKVLKSFSTVEKKVVTSDPHKICEIFFGKGVTPASVSTFAGALAAVNSDKFPHTEKREDILMMALDGIKKKGLKSPKI